MAEDPRTPGPDSTTDVPRGLLEALARPSDECIRAYEVARGRRRAVERAFDDGDVVDEIASRLLVLSSQG
jgi:hypothetical protein